MKVVAGSLLSPPLERVELYRRLFDLLRSPRQDLFRFWLLPFEGLPFRLGESLAEAKIPYAFDDVLDRAAGGAMEDLLFLIQRRFAPSFDETTGSGPRLREECMSSRYAPEDSLERKAVLRGARVDPHLDCGLLDSWLSRGSPATTLLSGLHSLFVRAIEEEVGSRGSVCHAYLATIAAADMLDRKKEVVKAASIRGMSYERLEKAVGSAVFMLVEVAARFALESFRRKNLGVDLGRTWLLMETALNPLSYMSIKSRALQNDLNPWELSPSTAAVLDELYEEVLLRDPEPAALEERMTAALASNGDAAAAAARCGLRGEARRRIFGFLSHFDDGRTDWLRMLASVVKRDAELDALMSGSRSLDAIRRQLDKLERRHRIDERGALHLKELRDMLVALGTGDPTRRTQAGLPDPEALSLRGLLAFLAYALDRFSDGRLEEAKGHLHHERTARISSAELGETWKAGRLYRFSPDGRPFVMPLRRTAQAQLFIDLKGFTRRTHRAKEVVMADFMREKFYKPILEAARRRVSGLEHGGYDEYPIELHNLLGDAAAFAGATADLVELASDLRRIGREYAKHLDSAAPSTGDEAVLDELSREAEKKGAGAREQIGKLRRGIEIVREELERKAEMQDSEKVMLLESLLSGRFEELESVRSEALRRLEASEGRAAESAAAHLRRLDAWEKELVQRQEATRKALAVLSTEERSAALSELISRPEKRRLADLEEELARVEADAALKRRMLEERRGDIHGFGLETGIYISHGANAEVISFDDEVFGPLRVAISEKINEAARGTARNAEIKAKMDAHLERAREQRGRPGLSWPFLVYVDAAYSLVLPPQLSASIERAVREKDTVAAEEASVDLGRWALRDMSRAMGHGDGKTTEMVRPLNDIHNLGVALSQEAVAAFIEETLASRYHFQHKARVAALHRDLQEPFVYLDEHVSLVVSVPAETSEKAVEGTMVFRYAGDVQFRGFERGGATGVYELLAPDTRFFRLLMKHHLGSWIEEAREDPTRLITSL